MNRKLKPAGTLLFGRAMLSHLAYEMDILGIQKPVILTNTGYRSRARRAAARIGRGYSRTLKLTLDAPAADNDFLIFAGGREMVDAFKTDPRPRAWILLRDEDLTEVTETAIDFLVLDTLFVRKKENIQGFMRRFALGITDGLALYPGDLVIPEAFTYSSRTEVHTGFEALGKLPELLSRIGMKHPMVLTDRGIVAAGLLDMLSTVIAGNDVEFYDDIPPDSSSRVVNDISRIYREKKRDGLIAIGGGSVLDTGKGVLMNVSLGLNDLTVFAGSNRIPKLDTPFIAIPTTSGTGSEVTKVAVIRDAEKNRKILYVSSNLQPDYGILDARLTASLPPYLTSITGMDALSHAVEAFTCLGKNPVSDQMAWKAIELIRDNLVPVISNPSNLSRRNNLALASNMAGQAFSNSMVGMVHTIGHSIGAVCHAPHGSCMAVLLPASLEYNFPVIRSLLEELLTALAGEDYARSVPAENRAGEAIEFIRKMNYTLRELTGNRHPVRLTDILGKDGKPLVRESNFSEIADVSLGDASIFYNPVEFNRDDILSILRKSY